jgi:hypothetical protein
MERLPGFAEIGGLAMEIDSKGQLANVRVDSVCPKLGLESVGI